MIRSVLEKMSPAIPRRALLVLAGAAWTAVGIMLLNYGYTWLTHPPVIRNLGIGILSVAASLAVYRIGFNGIALKNIARIRSLKEKPCAFSFLAWKGYLIIAVMMTMGILLRGSSIPRPYLAIVYVTIGGALFLSSLSYYSHFYQGFDRMNPD
jgi:hypothetical protein